MKALPAEMVVEVLRWLEARDLATGQRVCRSWRRLLRCDANKNENAAQGLWREAYLRTWPLPLAPTAAGGGPAQERQDDDDEGDEDELRAPPSSSEVNWKDLCMLRLRLQHNCSLEHQMAAVARALSSGAEAAVKKEEPSRRGPARRTAKRRRNEPAPAPTKKPKKRLQERSKARAGRGRSKAEEAEEAEEIESDDEAVITGLPPLAGPWTDPPQMVEAQRLVEQAEKMVSSLSEIASMRDKAQRLLSAISTTTARGREVHRLLSCLFDHTLHDTVSAFLGSTLTLEGPYAHKVHVVMFSLATGLPLRMEWDCVNGIEGEPNDQRQAWTSDDGSISFETDNPDDVEAEDEHTTALMAFLFGAAHARVVRPAELESFFRALFTPTNCPNTFELKLQSQM